MLIYNKIRREEVYIMEETDNKKVEETKNENVKEAEVVKSKKNNSLCLASFVCSLVGLLIFGLPLGIVALITGIMGVVKFNSNTEKGKWMGITGICVGTFDIIMVIYSMMVLSSTIY